MKKIGLTLIALTLSAGLSHAAVTRTFEGRVKSVDDQNLTLDVAGNTVKLAGSQQQFSQIKKGQTVQVQATPDLKATAIDPIRGSFAGDQLVGTVEQMQQNQATIKTLNGQTETVRVDPDMMKQVQQGEQVVVQLKEDPKQAKDWRATQVKPIPSGQQQPAQQPMQQPMEQQNQQQQPPAGSRM